MMFTIVMNLERSTKGTHVYSSADPSALIRTLYIVKTPSTPPAQIKVTVVEHSPVHA